MPQYLYSDPATGYIKEVTQRMSEDHVYSENGVDWVRVWTIPQAGIDANPDPFDAGKFAEKTAGKGETIGDMWDRSRDMSEKRAGKRDGLDKKKKDYFDNYARKRRGAVHPSQRPSEITVSL